MYSWVQPGTDAKADAYICSVATSDEINLEKSIREFWEIEHAFESKKPRTMQEEDVEKYFEVTTTHDENGGFIVRLPFVGEKSTIGITKKIAESRLYMLEKRLRSRPVQWKK